MPQNALNPDQIRVLSWNIAKGQREGWDSDLTVLSHNSDLVLIQEARLEHGVHRYFDDCCWAFAPGFTRGNVTTGVMTIASAETLRHIPHAHREPLTRLPKAALVTEYRLQDNEHTLMVANVHAINFTPGTLHFRRQLEGLYTTLREHQGPLILSGDFNTWRNKRVEVLSALVEALRLHSVEYEGDCRRQAFGQALDHVFYRGMHQDRCRVLPVLSSDHNPIQVVLRA